MSAKPVDLRRARGQAIVLIALAAVALVAFVGLAIDGGGAMDGRRVAQNAADAGVMAGVYELSNASTGAVIAGKVQSYTVSSAAGNAANTWRGNYLPSGTVINSANSPGGSDNCLVVTTTVGVKPYFIGIMGFNVITTTASAAACSGSLMVPPNGLRPFGTYQPDNDTFQLNKDYTFFESGSGPSCQGDHGTDCFSWLDLDGNANANKIATWLRDGFSGTYRYYTGNNCSTSNTATTLPVPTCVAIKTGVSTSSNVRAELTTLDNNATPIIIPIYNQCEDDEDHGDSCGNGSNTKMRITGFAKFVVTSFQMTGSNKYIRGHFLAYVDAGQICNPVIMTCGVGSVLGKGIQLIR